MATYYTKKNGGHGIKFTIDDDRKELSLGAKYAKKTAIELKGIIEKLIACRDNHQLPDKRVFAYLETAVPEIREKLEAAHLIKQSKIRTLGQLWDVYLEEKQYGDSTQTHWLTNRKRFFTHFKEADPIEALTRESILQYKKHLAKEYAEATVSTSFAKVRAICRWATDEKDLFLKNPCGGLKGGTYRNEVHDRFVEMVDYEKMLDACHTQEQRTILTLARVGGLRIPSEIVGFTWKDIDWNEVEGRIWVNSPKTAHVIGGKGRFVPLWEPIRRELQKLYFADDPDGKDDRVFPNRKMTSNLRTRFEQIQIRAGLTPIPRFFDNNRASRSTEVFNEYGANLESKWIGHTEAEARRAYYQVRDIDFRAALKEEFGTKPPDIPVTPVSENNDTFQESKSQVPCFAT